MRGACSAPSVVQTARGPVECVIAGEGPAILALHGGMGGHDQSWILARALLPDAGGYRIVAVSRPGYLGTPLRTGGTPEEQADLYAHLLDALGIAASAVICVSAGGPSALQFAVRHPDRCRALVLVSACSGRLETPPEVASRLRKLQLLAGIPGLTAILRWRAEKKPDAAAARAIPDPGLRARTLAHPAAGPLLRALQASVLDRPRQRLPGTVNDTALFARLDACPLAMIAAPTLVVHGTADSVVPFSHAANVASKVPGAEVVAIEAGAHVALFTHLEEIRARTGRFLAAHYPAA